MHLNDDTQRSRSGERPSHRIALARGFAALLLAVLAACTTPPKREPSPPPIVRDQARWVPARWTDLPGWTNDSVLQAWPALMRSCERPAAEWAAICAAAQQARPRSEADVRAWLASNLRPYRVETLQGEARGLATGYYEPVFDARRRSGAGYRYALYGPPADLATRKPWFTREEIETSAAARAALKGREIAWLADPFDALALQIQGSGRLRVAGPDGRVQLVRLAYAGNNDRPYRSIGRWLIDQGELPAGQASWPAIREWARQNPSRTNELLWANPRYVFFREEPVTDPALGPRGAQGVPLTPGRSIAVDPKNLPYGTLVWLDTTEPLSSRPLQRLVVAQDTGSAIVGPIRADYFWGWDGDAAEQAGRMKQPLRLWVLWPASNARPRG